MMLKRVSENLHWHELKNDAAFISNGLLVSACRHDPEQSRIERPPNGMVILLCTLDYLRKRTVFGRNHMI